MRNEQPVKIIVIGNENHGNSSSPGNAYSALSVGAVEKVSRNQVEVAEQIHHSAAPALLEIDDIFKHHNGKRLAVGVNALGAVPIETTAAGIHALAASERVAAILEDQLLSPLSTPSSA